MAELPTGLMGLIIFSLGACIGSFLNVCIFRIPAGTSVVTPPSACRKCGHRLAWWENIPLISFLILRGKCRSCGEKISIQYPIVEFLNGVLYVLLWLRFGLGLEMAIYAVFVSAMLVVTFIDLEHYIIPDVISLPGIIICFGASFLLPGLSWQDSLLGIVVGGGILLLVAWVYYLMTKREGMGGGDVKLLAMIGALLGWKAIPAVIFLSAASGAIVGIVLMLLKERGRQHPIPFGPFLAGAAVIYIFYGQRVMDWYLSLVLPSQAM